MTREDWIAALRSGKYEQGHGVLKSGDKFCCLGVACELAKTFPAPNNEGQSWITSFLPIEVLEMLGGTYDSKNEAQVFAIGKGQITTDELAQLNDDRGFSFSDIADILEGKRVFTNAMAAANV